MLGWPFKTHPTGWYQVGWTIDVAPGEVKAMKLFSKEVVLYRTASGVLNMLDAYCPHLGAHLGHGGCVKGETLQCPFHGWQYDLNGKNVAIPYTDQVAPKAQAGTWAVTESQGMSYVWYDALGREPLWGWDLIPEYERIPEDFYPLLTHHFGTKTVKPQLAIENTADPTHFPHVHGSSEPARLREWNADGHHVKTVFELSLGGGKESTWLTPEGPINAVIEGEAWGLGLSIARFLLGDFVTVQLVAVTPVDDDISLVMTSVSASRDPRFPNEPGGRAKRMMEDQVPQIGSDFNIWENQRYVERPMFFGTEERDFARLRRWVRQFYPDAVGSGDPNELTDVGIS